MVTCESLDHIGSLSESAQSANQSINLLKLKVINNYLVRASDKFQKEKIYYIPEHAELGYFTVIIIAVLQGTTTKCTKI